MSVAAAALFGVIFWAICRVSYVGYQRMFNSFKAKRNERARLYRQVEALEADLKTLRESYGELHKDLVHCLGILSGFGLRISALENIPQRQQEPAKPTIPKAQTWREVQDFIQQAQSEETREPSLVFRNGQ